MANPQQASEPGYNGDLLSLGGVVGPARRGRQAYTYSFTLSAQVLIVPANPKRIALILQNLDDAANPGSKIQIYIGTVNNIPLVLSAFGTLQLDVNFPWTGEIYANLYTGGTLPVVSITEISTL